MPRLTDYYSVTVKLVHETDLAILVTQDGTNEVWVPKSVCQDIEKVGRGMLEITLPETKVEEYGFD